MYLHVPLDVKKFVGCLTTFDRENLFCLNALLSSASLSKLKSPKRNNGNSVFKELYIYEICFYIWWSIKNTNYNNCIAVCNFNTYSYMLALSATAFYKVQL